MNQGNSARAIAIALCLLMHAVPDIASAYTTKRTPTGAFVRWTAKSIDFQIDSSRRGGIDPEQIRAAMLMASDAWRGLPGSPDILIQEGEAGKPGYSRTGPTNAVFVLDEWPFNPNQLAVTVATYEEGSGRILDADIFVNGSRPFDMLSEQTGEDDSEDGDSDGSDEEGDEGDDHQGHHHGRATKYDLAAVLTHEMGHVLGLGESGEDPLATMWPNIGKGETHQRTLTTDDEDGVVTLYKASEIAATAPPSGCGGASVVPQPAGRARSFVWAHSAALVVAAGAYARRRRRTRRNRSVA